MALNPVVIAGSLSKEELEKSINEIVKTVDVGMSNVTKTLDTKLTEMQSRLQSFSTTLATNISTMTKNIGGSFDTLAASMNKISAAGAKGAKAATGATGKNDTYEEGTVGALKAQIRELSKKLNYEKLSTRELQEQVNLLRQAQVELRKQTSSRTMASVQGMGEGSATDVAAKMRAYRNVTAQNAVEANMLASEYQRLSSKQNEMLGKTGLMTKANNALARSFSYIRSRIIYALTIGAMTRFVEDLYRVRSEYELLERSMGILIDDFRRGSEIFNELNQMAIKSPFTLIELGTAAKQLLAYNFAEDEVVDTTRRLADISAALGVPMERIVYNLGQIRAQTVLTARDARDFANAGLAIVPMLAKMYTEQKKFGDEIVTTAQVYDMMKKKLVSYEDVMKVINQVTDEGGKFFDFQAKQAETLKVQLANLALAWNNMMNDIGKSNHEALVAPIKLLKQLFFNWKEVADVLKTIIALYGMYIARAKIVALVNAGLAAQNAAGAMYSLGRGVGYVVQAWKSLSVVVASNPLGAIATVAAAGLVAFNMFGNKTNELSEYIERFGESGGKVVRDVENLYTSLESVNKESSSYKKVLGELNLILEDYGIQQISEKDGIDQIIESRAKNIQLIKEEIIERERLNNINAGQEKYESKLKDIRSNLVESLSDAITTSFGIGTVNQEISKNAPAIATIIESIVEENIDLVADKTGEELKKGQQKIWDKIQNALRSNKALGLSEDTLNSAWLQNDFIRAWNSNIIQNTISAIKEAKEEQNRWNRAIEEHAEIQKHDAQAGATFKDRVEQTSHSLMTAASDTEKFYQKINELVKEYSGQNIIDFLVRVKSQVPAWMSKMGVSELTRLSAQFAAFAQNAEKSGLDKIDVNGKTFTKAELYERAAQYASALQSKTAEIEARRTEKLTSAASEALKDYKSSLEAVTIAKNKLKQGTADSTLVTEKEAEAQKKYNAALKAGVSEKELEEARLGKKGKGGSKKDELGDSLTKELQLITDIQKLYKEYTKAGVDSETAKNAAAKEYQKTLEQTNATLSKFGVQGLTGEQLATMDLRAMRDYYQSILDKVQSSPKAVEALEKAIRNLNVEITKEGQKTIIDSLNSELSKLKDEYELAVELDANPELGGVFADMMGLSKEELEKLPRDFEGVVRKLQSVVDKELGMGAFDVRSNLNKDVFDQWIKANKYSQNSELVAKLKALTEYANKVRLDETKKQIEDWNKLLEKYAEYEYKRTQIMQEAERERETARKKGAGSDVINAIDLRERRELAKLDFEQFQNTPTWIAATGDLAGMTSSAIGMLISKLEQYKKSAKNLDPKQIKQINSALKKLYSEQRKGNPFAAIANAMDEAKERFNDYQLQIDEAGERIDVLNEKLQTEVGLTEAEKLELADLIGKIKEWREEQEKVGKVSASAIVEDIQSMLQSINQVTGAIGEMFSAFGDSESSETIKKVTQMLDKAASFAAMGAQIGGGWGAAIGGIVGLLVGGLTSFAEEINGNAQITRQVEASERAVKRLQNAYVNLERSVEKAYGTEKYYAIQVSQANKQAELAELRRQLRLEQSRSSKYRDENKILDLNRQIIELENNISDTLDDITNDFLGISSIGDAVENMVSSVIESLRNGENAMEVFDQSIEDMIVNMVKKLYSTKLVGPWFEKLWNSIDTDIENRTQEYRDDLAKLERAKQGLVGQIYENGKFYGSYLQYFGEKYDAEKIRWIGSGTGRLMEGYTWETVENAIKSKLAQSGEVTADDIRKFTTLANSSKEEMASELDDFMTFLRELGLMKDTANEKLSNLQQGIQGITEDTASALEAYMNGVSQQVYLHSDLLTQIRDAVVGFDFDVQLGVQSQMLLQLQNNYIVMQSMQSLMENWTTPAGNGIRVEVL